MKKPGGHFARGRYDLSVAAPRTADELRAAFTGFFAARGHTVVPSSSLIPHDPSIMLTIAGMVQFKPYFLGDETPPYTRATSVQKVARAGGKDSDLDNVGRTNRHFSFFEMLGNFSFGDYFKAEVIPWAWELVTQVFELDPDRIWVTVHATDDEAQRIWTDVVGLPAERVQRMSDDNFWRMGDTGPCGPSSEIFYDLGPEFGPEGGPAKTEERYLEIWNLVFMQFDAQPDGELLPLPKPSIDTGAGLERNLAVLQGVASAWETDLLLPLVEAAARGMPNCLQRFSRRRARPLAPDPGRPRPHDDLPHCRWRRAVERRARVRRCGRSSGVPCAMPTSSVPRHNSSRRPWSTPPST